MAKTVKLKYDFDTSRSCEIKHMGKWYRVTSRQFRSYDGERRISIPVSFDKNDYESYEGPIYLFATNNLVESKNTNKIIYTSEGDPRDKNKVNRRPY